MSFIYVLETDDLPYFKLGYTKDIAKRVGDLATGLPFDVEVRLFVTATRDDERQCHQLLKPYRKRNEWYCATPAVISFVDDLEFAADEDGGVAGGARSLPDAATRCRSKAAPQLAERVLVGGAAVTNSGDEGGEGFEPPPSSV